MTKNIVIIEPRNWGHHPSVTQVLVKELLSFGCNVGCATDFGEILEPKELQSQKNKSSLLKCSKLSMRPFSWYPGKRASIKRLKFGMLAWMDVRRAVRRLERELGGKADIVYFNMLDEYVQTGVPAWCVDLLLKRSWGGTLVWVPSRFPDQPGNMERKMINFFKNSKRLKTLFALDEVKSTVLEKYVNRTIIPCPDFTNENLPKPSTLSTRIKELAKGRKIIGSIGVVDKRKGVRELFEVACAAHQLQRNDLFFIIVGRCNQRGHETDAEIISKKAAKLQLNNFYLLEEYINEDDFNGVVASLDIVWAVYRDFSHSSNILTKAAFAQKPVLVSKKGLLEHRVNKYHSGKVVDGARPLDVIDAIDLILAEGVDKEGIVRYYNDHSLTKFRNLLQQYLISN